MTLLQPWSAAIAGGVGLGILTLLYVLKLRRKSLRVGSTLLWEQALADVEVNTPWRRLRIDWLYVIQALAIAALAVAVGRPAMGIGSTHQRIIVVIDATASMGATDPGSQESRLQEAKRRAADLINNLRRAATLDAAVVALAGEAPIIRGFTRESAAVIEGIEGIAQTDETGDLRAALQAIGTLTAGTAGSEDEPPAVAYIFSDGGFGTADAAPADAPLLLTPPGVAIKLVRIGPDPKESSGNAGIVAISAQRDTADPAMVRIVARIISTYPTRRDIALRVLMDGSPTASSTAALPPRSEQVVELPVGVRTGGVLSLRILNDDALASDNTAQVVIDGVREPAVVVVGPGAGGKDADPLVVNFAQSVNAASRIVGAESLNAGLPAWKNVDLIVFDRVEPRAGLLPPVASVSLGAGLTPAGVALEPGQPNTVSRVVTWKRDNPLMRDVALDGLLLRGVGTLKLPLNGQALAESARGTLIGLVEGADGVPHVVCAFDASQGGWGSDLSFVVFMGNAMDYLTLRGRTKAGRQITAGDELTVRVPRLTGELTVTAPGGAARQVTLQPADTTTEFRIASLGRAQRAGVYRIAGATGDEDQAGVAVNVGSTIESSLATADALPLRLGAAAPAAGGSSQPREVWDWFVLAATGLLAAEWLLYAVMARR